MERWLMVGACSELNELMLGGTGDRFDPVEPDVEGSSTKGSAPLGEDERAGEVELELAPREWCEMDPVRFRTCVRSVIHSQSLVGALWPAQVDVGRPR